MTPETITVTATLPAPPEGWGEVQWGVPPSATNLLYYDNSDGCWRKIVSCWKSYFFYCLPLDPRDKRIAKLEAGLSKIEASTYLHHEQGTVNFERLQKIAKEAQAND